MVGPISTDERAAQLRLLKTGIALLVGISMGLVTIQTQAELPVVGGAVLVGTVFGAVLAWYVFPSAEDYEGDGQDERSYRR
jgi:pimeloyl-ACP methyl ester carboxylesterase